MQYNFIKPCSFDKEFKAHTSGNKEKETLQEHLDHIMDTSSYLMECYGLHDIVNNMAKSIYPEKHNEIVELFHAVIYLHDYGKINPFYQKYKMGENVESYQKLRDKLGSQDYNEEVETSHSILSVIYFLDHYYHKFVKNGKDKKMVFIINCFSYNIIKHHSSFLSNVSEYELNNKFDHYIQYVDGLNMFENKFFKIDNALNSEVLWYLLRLNFGLLTKSDYISTMEYMKDYKYKENVLTVGLKKHIKNKFWKSKTFKDGSSNFNFKRQVGDLNPGRSFGNINVLRKKMLNESFFNYVINKDSNVFFLECPTGGGKTNISTAIITEAIQEENVKKVFYVFPFNKLSDQTEGSLINSLHLSDDEISSVNMSSYKEVENKEVSVYNKDMANMVNNTFMNFPLLLMSHVRFFDIIKSNSKSSMYNLMQLANSVVVLDEIQAYDPKVWSKMVYFIDNYSKLFNIKFVIMSATLPKIDQLIKNDKANFVRLIENKNNYFLNENFKNRVRYDFGMLDTLNISNDDISDSVFSKSQDYYKKHGKCHTVLEFIYKKDASDFSREFRNTFESAGYKVMLMSSTTLKPKSNRILHDIKKGGYEKVLLICTQCIEAGVDIDMDLGFKDVSILDSEEQLGGRVNRNASKSDSVVYLFNKGNKFIYKEDLRFSGSYGEKYRGYLETKDFDSFYEGVLVSINKNDETNLRHSLDNLKKAINNCNFSIVDDEFKIIAENEANRQVFIPIDIPLSDMFGYEVDDSLIVGDYISGGLVWLRYKELVENRRFIDLKRFKKMLSIFMVSLYIGQRKYDSFLEYVSVDDGTEIHYVDDMRIYDYDDGFNLSVINNSLTYEFL